MKKSILNIAAIVFLFISCNDDGSEEILDQSSIKMYDFYAYTDADSDEPIRIAQGKSVCYSMVNLNRLLNENKELHKKMYDIEYHTRNFIDNNKPQNNNSGNENTQSEVDHLGIINIPVYVHVIYSNSQQNISDAQINSQIAVLNADFRKKNNDADQTPIEFSSLAVDSKITFSLAGTYRHSNSRASWGTNDAMKIAYPPITPKTHLNIWVCNIGDGILGYAQFPGGPPVTDGVVIPPQYFGNQGFVSAPYNEGRTATHEVGHYFNLRHIWGDGRCKRDDFVKDTPNSDGPNYNCPSYPKLNCHSNDMTMNFMDYTNDACKTMFSVGQKSRMRAILQPGRSRASLINN